MPLHWRCGRAVAEVFLAITKLLFVFGHLAHGRQQATISQPVALTRLNVACNLSYPIDLFFYIAQISGTAALQPKAVQFFPVITGVRCNGLSQSQEQQEQQEQQKQQHLKQQ